MSEKFGKIITYCSFLIPLMIGGIFVFFKFKFNLNYKLEGYNDVLVSVITFASIIIGFYTAMYGALLTLKDSDIMRAFRENKLTGILKFQLYDSLTVSFFILFLSISLQIFVRYPGNVTGIIFNIWTFAIGYFITTSFRAISLLLKIMFNSNDRSAANMIESEPSTETEKQERYQRLSSNNIKHKS